MSLENLSASELAQIDSICLEYELNYRRGNASDISLIVAAYNGPHVELLRQELETVRDELQSDETISQSIGGSRRGSVSSFSIPAVGTTLGPYVVGELIGRGGMGVVLEAVDQRLNRRVAIKMLAMDIATRSDLTERFDREARSVAAISHPNIVELFDVGSHDGLPYAVMEFLDGELLSDRMKRQSFTVDETRGLGAQIADALSKAHQAQVIHRDLKPQNVMLVARDSGDTATDSPNSDPSADEPLVKLFDFGLSRTPRDQREAGDDETQEGVILGTPGYMAPEQALGESATASADIFALGCILFEAFYGKRAFEGTTQIKRHQATLVAQPDPDPIQRRRDPALADLIDQCLAKDPGKRPASAALIARQLRNRGQSSNLVAERMRSGESAGRFTRRRIVELVAGGAAGGVFAAAWAVGRPNRLADIRSIGVLSFADDTSARRRSETTMMPKSVGATPLSAGDQLSAMLVHELTKINNITVPPFRPMTANLPEEYRQIGDQLMVDALLDGSIRKDSQGSKQFLTLDVRLVSAKDGSQLWGNVFHADADDNLLQKSHFAAEIASSIGHRLTSSLDADAPPSPDSFSCLVDGKVRCDPDSPAGLRMALKCFANASSEDIRQAEPFAGLALTSITLAAQTSEHESVKLIQDARDAAKEALDRQPDSIDARLAVAMLDWQTTEQYGQANRAFQTLLKATPNNWQIHHQYGLLQLTTGKTEAAIESLSAATLRNPFSVTVKTDLARAHWFAGDTDRALDAAIRVRDKSGSHALALGLLIDIYEQQQDFVNAARQHGSFHAATREDYISQREAALPRLPYGPFGIELNQAILKARTPSGLEKDTVFDLIDTPRLPMLPLVLARHPTFQSARSFDRGKEVLQRLENTT